MAEKKKRGRRAYLNDFQKDEKGSYVYQGELYEWKGETGMFHRELVLLWGICIAMLAALLMAGCVDAPGAMNCVYVVLPFTASFLLGFSSGWGLWRLTSGGNPLRAYIYEQSVERIPVRIIGTMIGAGTAIAGEIIFLFRNGFEGKQQEAFLFLLLEGTAFVMALFFRQRFVKMTWEKRKTKIDKLL